MSWKIEGGHTALLLLEFSQPSSFAESYPLPHLLIIQYPVVLTRITSRSVQEHNILVALASLLIENLRFVNGQILEARMEDKPCTSPK